MADEGTKDRIKRAAMRLFVAQGVDAVSMRDIAAAAGLKAPSLYAHFRSREELVSELFLPNYAAYGRRLAAVAGTDDPFRRRLREMVRLICALHAEDALLFDFLLITQHGNLRQVAPDDTNPVEVICRFVAEAMRAGDIPPGDPVLLAAAIIGAVVQPATFRLYGRLGRDLAEMADEIAAICLRIVS